MCKQNQITVMSNASKLNEFETAMMGAIISLSGNQFTQDAITALILATNKDSRCKFVKINDYNSDKSQNTEIASHLVNINVNYANVLADSSFTFDAITDADLAKVDVNDFDYSSINLEKLGMSLDAYKAAVKDVLKVALIEMKLPKASKETNDIWLNKALVFNKTTCRFSIFGQGEKKEVSVKGEYKKVASAPKTVAKQLIEKTFKPRQTKLRRYALDNIFTSVKIDGDTVEFA